MGVFFFNDLKNLPFNKFFFSIFKKNELVDKIFFEILHPSDTKQVKDQLTYYDMNNRKNIFIF